MTAMYKRETKAAEGHSSVGETCPSRSGLSSRLDAGVDLMVLFFQRSVNNDTQSRQCACPIDNNAHVQCTCDSVNLEIC
jgi:hypothetical protein